MNWELKSLKIEFMDWGEYKGKYAGKVEFANGGRDAFTFSLSADQCAEYLSLIAKTVGANASQLGTQITESLEYLKLTNNPIIQIQPSTA